MLNDNFPLDILTEFGRTIRRLFIKRRTVGVGRLDEVIITFATKLHPS